MLFANASPFIIVLGGTVLTLTIAFPLPTVLKFPKFLLKSMQNEAEDPLEVLATFRQLAEKARREGLLSLEDQAQQIENEFLRQGIQEVVDGTPPEQIQVLLETRIGEMEARHREGIALFEQGGGFSPTMGIIGTVLGLMSTLGSLAEAGTEQLGESIATAFIATFIGIMSANLFWLPLSQRLRKKSEEEASHLRMLVEGILAIQAGDAPRLVQTKLEGYLSPADKRRAQRLASGTPSGAAAAQAVG
jgi:chemotaxis protein MotA